MKPDGRLLRTVPFTIMLAIGGCASAPIVDVP